jgi:hypothetical protein
MRTTDGFELANQIRSDPTTPMRFRDTNLIEKHHLLRAIYAIEQVRDDIANRCVSQDRYQQYIVGAG